MLLTACSGVITATSKPCHSSVFKNGFRFFWSPETLSCTGESFSNEIVRKYLLSFSFSWFKSCNIFSFEKAISCHEDFPLLQCRKCYLTWRRPPFHTLSLCLNGLPPHCLFSYLEMSLSPNQRTKKKSKSTVNDEWNIHISYTQTVT